MDRSLLLALLGLLVVGCSGPKSNDFDGDGSADSVDCAPDDPSIFLGATELCNDGIDNDCDRSIDCSDPDCIVLGGCNSGDDDDSAGDDDDSAGDDDDSAGDDDDSSGATGVVTPTCDYLSFDGIDDFAEVLDHSDLAFAGHDYTMEWWVLLDGAPGNVVVSKRSPGLPSGYLMDTGPGAASGCCSGGGAMYFNSADPTFYDYWNYVNTTYGWHHMALTYDSVVPVSTFWVDGVAIATSTTFVALSANNSNLWLGRHRVTDTIYSEFSLAGVHLASVVLYEETFLPGYPLQAIPSTAALWLMDEGAGAVLSDSSGRGHDAALTGGTWSSCP